MTDNRIAEIEAKIASAQVELAALKAGGAAPLPQPVRGRDEGPRVVLIEDRTTFVRPTLNELRKLYEIVCSKYPQFRPAIVSGRFADQDAAECFAGFEWSFERLGHIGRLGAPDTRRYVDHWVEEARDWLRLHRPSHGGNIGAGFLAACVAHGDIPYVVGDKNLGVVWVIGVAPFGGRPASDAWRAVLKGGNVMAPSQPARRFEPPSPARVYGY
jgi:hypothetical protein